MAYKELAEYMMLTFLVLSYYMPYYVVSSQVWVHLGIEVPTRVGKNEEPSENKFRDMLSQKARGSGRELNQRESWLEKPGDGAEHRF